MPYKDPKDPRNIAQAKAYYERTKEDRYQKYKHNTMKWRAENPEKYKESVIKYRQKTKERRIEKQRTYNELNKENIKASIKKAVKELSDPYMKRYLVKLGYSREDLEKYPQIIETKRMILKTKRL